MKFVFVTFYEICYLNDTSSSWVLAGSHFKKTPESLASIWFNQIFDLGPLQQIQCHYAISGFLKIWVGWSWKTTKKEKYITIKKDLPSLPEVNFLKWVECSDNEFVGADQRSYFSQVCLSLSYTLSFILKFSVVFV